MFGIPDRFWWVQRYGGGLFAIGCLTGVVYSLRLAYDFSQLEQGGFLDPRIPPLDVTQSFLLAGTFAVFLAQAVVAIWASLSAQRRFLRRLRAIAGDQEAMPCASIEVDRRHAPDLACDPLELLWRATPLNGRIMTVLIACMVVLFGPFALLFCYLAYCLATNTALIGSISLGLLPPLVRVLTTAGMLGVGMLTLFLVLFMIWHLPWERGRAYGVTASDEGVWYYPKDGKKRFLRWNEVCLLEARIPRRDHPYREYRLYGRRGVALWHDVPPSRWVSLGLSSQEYSERHQALLDLIVARTGLLPRTFEKKLQKGELATSRQASRFAPLANAGCLTIMLLAALGFALALLLVPLSTYPPLNLLEGGALAAALVLTTNEAIIRGFAQRIARRRPVTTLDPVLSSDPGAVYVLVRRRSLPARIISLLVALLLVVGFLPALVLWLPGGGQSLAPGADLRIATGFGVIAAYILLGCALIGVLVAISTVRSTTTTYRADREGLSQSTRGRERTRIRWRSLADLVVWELAGSSRIYRATDSGQQQNVVWQGGPSDARQALNPGETLIAGEQLAEIVARRSSVSLRVSSDLVQDSPFSRARND